MFRIDYKPDAKPGRGSPWKLIRGSLQMTAGLLISGLVCAAQPVGVPASCTGKTGAELDLCVRAETAPQPVMVPVDKPASAQRAPSNIVQCMNFPLADKNLCVKHNQVVIDCQKVFRDPDKLTACITPALDKLPKPVAANCAKEINKATAAQCATRNRYFRACSGNSLEYFRCIEEKIAKG